MRAAAASALLAAALAASASGAAQGGYAFGRLGGNILPFTVSVAASGGVHVTGPVRARRATLTEAQLASLRSLAAGVRFGTLPLTTRCPGTNPDVATTFVRVGARTVSVHGRCVSRFNRIWDALSAAVKLGY
ncbi:MAG: hypothetical protein ACYDCH_13925 [Gaiellaceae bacterium]